MPGTLLRRDGLTRQGDRIARPIAGCVLVSALLVCGAGVAASQAPAPVGWIEVGLVAGLVAGLPHVFDYTACGDEPRRGVAGAGRVGVPVLGRGRLEAGLDIAASVNQPQCVLDPPRPPQNGEFVQPVYPARYVGYPLFQPGLRAAWTLVEGGAVELRLTGGVEHALGRGLWMPTAGVVLPVGRGNLRGVLEVESLWYAIPMSTRTTVYQNGAVISESETTQTIRTRSTRIRAGVLVPIP